MKTGIILITFCSILVSFAFAQGNQNAKTSPFAVIQDSVTAIKVAEAILLPMYGEKNFKQYLPLRAYLKEERIWVVESSNKYEFLGSTPNIELQRSDCKVLKIAKGK
jgi:hypothetical protein